MLLDQCSISSALRPGTGATSASSINVSPAGQKAEGWAVRVETKSVAGAAQRGVEPAKQSDHQRAAEGIDEQTPVESYLLCARERFGKLQHREAAIGARGASQLQG
jgi:hypothetical protein